MSQKEENSSFFKPQLPLCLTSQTQPQHWLVVACRQCLAWTDLLSLALFAKLGHLVWASQAQGSRLVTLFCCQAHWLICRFGGKPSQTKSWMLGSGFSPFGWEAGLLYLITSCPPSIQITYSTFLSSSVMVLKLFLWGFRQASLLNKYFIHHLREENGDEKGIFLLVVKYFSWSPLIKIDPILLCWKLCCWVTKIGYVGGHRFPQYKIFYTAQYFYCESKLFWVFYKMDYAVNLREATDTLVCSGFEFCEGNSPTVGLYCESPRQVY